jgi:chromosome transmission fidelity protein 1
MERDFDFPGTPYEIQQQFMSSLYTCLSSYKVGIFESPTGTGKSLSLICSSFKWLKDHKSRLCTDENFSGSQSWVNDPPSSSAALAEITNTLQAVDEPQKPEPKALVKLIYASRTHSQLDQFLNEIKKTHYKDNTSVIRLGSRNQLCVNPELSSFKGRSLIDYKCKELIDPNAASSCPYFKSNNVLKKHCLETVSDIEELVSFGRSHRACPFFATRAAIPAAEVILAPYNLVLNKRSREAIGLDLSDSVLIIDEAHNIVEAMGDCYSASLTKPQAEASLQALRSYYDRFASKVGARSAMCLDQIISVIQGIISFMVQHCASKTPSVVNIGNFLIDCRLERIDLFKLIMFVEEFEMIRKVTNLAEKGGNKACVASLPLTVEFLRTLCDDVSAGKILVNANEEPGIRYLLLDPKNKFRELALTARCIVLAGGSMEPKAEILGLFSNLPQEKIMKFTCDHVIAPSNLLLGVVGKGDGGASFRFTYDNRDNARLMTELGDLLCQLTGLVPNGVVVFVPSYFFLSKLRIFMEKSGMLGRIKTRKEVFFDNKEENLLETFSAKAKNPGAMLFAVVRGKLSEGINFSDHLGRCVVIIGMPYLNRTDVEIQEKMRFLDATGGEFNGRQFYEASCHKAINQSIGRVIRHKNDYAVVLLVDDRYSQCMDRRPKWMMQNLIPRQVDWKQSVQTFFDRFRTK